MVGYAVVNLTDIREVYVKTGLLNRFFGTGSVFVTYRDFQSTTEYWKPHGKIIVHQGYPSFNSIEATKEVKDLILDESARARVIANQF